MHERQQRFNVTTISYGTLTAASSYFPDYLLNYRGPAGATDHPHDRLSPLCGFISISHLVKRMWRDDLCLKWQTFHRLRISWCLSQQASQSSQLGPRCEQHLFTWTLQVRFLCQVHSTNLILSMNSSLLWTKWGFHAVIQLNPIKTLSLKFPLN